MSGDPREVPDATLPDGRLPDGRLPNVGWLALVLRDVQFWVPVVVLAAGLLVLRWITSAQAR